MGMSFLDCNGILIPTMFDYWKEGGTGGGGTVSGIAVYGRDVRDLRDDKSLKTPRKSKTLFSQVHCFFIGSACSIRKKQ